MAQAWVEPRQPVQWQTRQMQGEVAAWSRRSHPMGGNGSDLAALELYHPGPLPAAAATQQVKLPARLGRRVGERSRPPARLAAVGPCPAVSVRSTAHYPPRPAAGVLRRSCRAGRGAAPRHQGPGSAEPPPWPRDRRPGCGSGPGSSGQPSRATEARAPRPARAARRDPEDGAARPHQQ